jgi:isochorismate synthase
MHQPPNYGCIRQKIMNQGTHTINKTQKSVPIADLRLLINWAVANQYGIAVWKLPRHNGLQLAIDYQGGSIVNAAIPGKEGGFIVHPFETGLSVAPWQIKLDSFVKLNGIFTLKPEESSDYQLEINQSVWEEVQKNSRLQKTLYHKGQANHAVPSSKHDFEAMVQKAVEAIKADQFQKVVPARTKKVRLKADFDLAEGLLTIGQENPNAFVSMVSIPTVGTWLGATPEILVTQSENLFQTVALAGTQPYRENKRIEQTHWTQKEIEEQALVSRYIINCFKKIRLRDFDEYGPRTVKAGSLLHLKTEFSVNMTAVNFPDLVEVMLQLLHPTSAVCGMPKAASLAFLHQHETFDRKYFSGFLGPVNIENSTQLFVNLRCAELFEEEALLYAGAGVTNDSIPAKEWAETGWKCAIIGKYLTNA